MRLWSFHPRYLDAKGLVAVWREALLAQKVLLGETIGYTNHPQLRRFSVQPDSLAAAGAYLRGIWDEAVSRGYKFDSGKILRPGPAVKIPVTAGQLDYEFRWLLHKVQGRAPEHFMKLRAAGESRIECHPIFTVVDGGIERWERIRPDIDDHWVLDHS
ncbi:pyrimidine dimer DNA glycosylase/endonuclease V [candidate division KSB1 bacterium]